MKPTTPSEMLIRQRLAAVTRMLPGARDGDAESLHQARVATRRLREALPLVAQGSRGRKLEKSVRRLTRALGPVRELDVALITLDELQRPSAGLCTVAGGASTGCGMAEGPQSGGNLRFEPPHRRDNGGCCEQTCV